MKKASPLGHALLLGLVTLLGSIGLCGTALAFQASAETLPLASQQISLWTGPDGSPLPFQNNREIEEFLKNAEVKKTETISTGINQVKKVLLELDGVQAHGVFRDVRVQKQKVQTPTGWRLDFRDDCRYECAAYELSKLLGMDSIPPAAVRKVEGKTGTIQIWIERAKMEKDRQEEKLQPPDPVRWALQMQTMRLFDNLIFNDDRNQGNVLIDQNWKMWLIDHTRAFRTLKDLPTPQLITACDKTVWENLGTLTEDLLKEKLDDYLRGSEINSILARRDKLVKLIQGEIDQKGENAVLFTTY